MADLEEKTDVSAKATPGETGQFDVLADGQLIFSKQTEGRFPEHDEILSQLG